MYLLKVINLLQQKIVTGKATRNVFFFFFALESPDFYLKRIFGSLIKYIKSLQVDKNGAYSYW